MSVIFFSNMLIFNGMFYDLFDKKRTIYISNRSLFKNIIKDYSIIIRLKK